MTRSIAFSFVLAAALGAPAIALAQGTAPAPTAAAPASPTAGSVSPGSGISSGTAASLGNTEVAPPTGLSTNRAPGNSVPGSTVMGAPAATRP